MAYLKSKGMFNPSKCRDGGGGTVRCVGLGVDGKTTKTEIGSSFSKGCKNEKQTETQGKSYKSREEGCQKAGLDDGKVITDDF